MSTLINPKTGLPHARASLAVFELRSNGHPKKRKAPSIILLNKSFPSNTEGMYLQLTNWDN